MSAPASNDRTSLPDELQLPVLGLYADLELGRGSVLLPDEFLQCSSGVRLEVVAGWLRGLERCRHDALLALHHDLCATQPQLPPAEQLALLRSTCAALGVEMPADFRLPPAPRPEC
jgi:hypothetical protein